MAAALSPPRPLRVAVVQLAPVHGDVGASAARCDALLDAADLSGVEIMVLPEMAFTGYQFESASHLPADGEAASRAWAAERAARHGCVVVVGAPRETPRGWTNAQLVVRPDGAFAARIFRRRVAATPRPRRGYSVDTSRREATVTTWMFGRHESRRRHDLDIQWTWIFREDTSRTPQVPASTTTSATSTTRTRRGASRARIRSRRATTLSTGCGWASASAWTSTPTSFEMQTPTSSRRSTATPARTSSCFRARGLRPSGIEARWPLLATVLKTTACQRCKNHRKRSSSLRVGSRPQVLRPPR